MRKEADKTRGEMRFTGVLAADEHAAVLKEAHEQGRSFRRQLQYIVKQWIQDQKGESL